MSTNKPVIVEMSHYLKRLAQESQAPISKAPDVDEDPGPATPLAQRLRVLIATLPPETVEHGMSIEWFRERLRGKYRRHPRAGDVAQALRTLGWVRRRGWQESVDGFRAKWFASSNAR